MEEAVCSIPDMLARVDYVNWTAIATDDDRQRASLNCVSVHQRMVEHNSDRCHSEMYFDIVLFHYYQNRHHKENVQLL